MRLIVLLVLLSGLTGCAGMSMQQNNEAGLADARAKIALGRCDEKLVADLNRFKAPELEQEAAYVCLQQGETVAVDRLLTDYGKRHRNGPYPDYSAYLMALAQQLRFELAEDDASRITEGRKAHQRFADFVQSYPESEYRVEVGPRLNTLLEDMAETEYRLALKTVEAGDIPTARARMSYIARYYQLSKAAKGARDWLEENQDPEAENVAPGTAW